MSHFQLCAPGLFWWLGAWRCCKETRAVSRRQIIKVVYVKTNRKKALGSRRQWARVCGGDMLMVGVDDLSLFWLLSVILWYVELLASKVTVTKALTSDSIYTQSCCVWSSMSNWKFSASLLLAISFGVNKLDIWKLNLLRTAKNLFSLSEFNPY